MTCNNQTNCIPYEEYIKVNELAKAYVPFQKLCGLFDIEEGLIKGTIFPELARPYCKSFKNIMKEDNPCGMPERNNCKNIQKGFSLFR